ncbi:MULTISPECIES: hypothetical protein [unclassified Calothrix]|nr:MULTISPECIES: hypothetical protein [unclassified Calothrix]
MDIHLCLSIIYLTNRQVRQVRQEEYRENPTCEKDEDLTIVSD